MPDWTPFVVVERGSRAPSTRSLDSPFGVGDRLRTAAFAEAQAKEAFLWAAQRFESAPADLREAWRRLAREEEKHLGWLLARMEAIGADVAERAVSDKLWQSLVSRESAEEFARYMAGAEDWGREAGEKFSEQLETVDPESAALFARIAREEQGHIHIARRFLEN